MVIETPTQKVDAVYSIFAGLNPQPGDRILTPPGDQMFALLRSRVEVVCAPQTEEDFCFVSKLIGFLHKNKAEFYAAKSPGRALYCHDLGELRKDYFEFDHRIERVQEGLMYFSQYGSMPFKETLEFSHNSNKIYDGGYLTSCYRSQEEITTRLEEMTTELPVGGLLYVDDHGNLMRRFMDRPYISLDNPNFLPDCLEFSRPHTEHARANLDLTNYPGVYRKISA